MSPGESFGSTFIYAWISTHIVHSFEEWVIYFHTCIEKKVREPLVSLHNN
jgi:hypothetical protein